MASLRLKFRSSSIAGKEGSLVYQIVQNRVTRIITTQYRILPSEWNERTRHIIIDNKSERREVLELIRDKINWEIRHISGIITEFECSGLEYSADDIVSKFDTMPKAQSVFSFMQSRIEIHKEQGRLRTSEAYTSALNSLRKFRNGKDFGFDSFSSDLMVAYETSMRSRGLVRNTTSFYMRIWRAVYNVAVDNGLTTDCRPFKHVFTGMEKTEKRAVSIDTIKALKVLNLSNEPKLDFARDVFMFSFYTRGMSFIDMAYLRKKDVKNGYIIYKRRKTGQQLKIKWEPIMQNVVNKYKDNKSEYLLPILKDGDERFKYLKALQRITRHLKKISVRLGLEKPLTQYRARHSWSNIAREKHIPISVISEGLGHDSERTTQIYLASLDASLVDKANHKILMCLR